MKSTWAELFLSPSTIKLLPFIDVFSRRSTSRARSATLIPGCFALTQGIQHYLSSFVEASWYLYDSFYFLRKISRGLDDLDRSHCTWLNSFELSVFLFPSLTKLICNNSYGDYTYYIIDTITMFCWGTVRTDASILLTLQTTIIIQG